MRSICLLLGQRAIPMVTKTPHTLLLSRISRPLTLGKYLPTMAMWGV